MADQKPDGLFITDDAGNVYYLRPEILAQAKMPDEDVKKLRAEIAASGKGDAKDQELSVDDLSTIAGGVNYPAATHVHVANVAATSVVSRASPSFDFSKVATSTVMCPW
jgi:hypothetical protein